MNKYSMKLIFKNFVAIAIFIIINLFSFQLAVSSESQRFGAGLTGGYFNAYNYAHYTYTCNSCGDMMDDFSKNSYFLGITFEIPLKLGLESSIITRLYYNSFSFKQSKLREPFWAYRSTNSGDTTFLTQMQFEWAGKYSLLTLDLLPKIKIPFLKFGFFAGLSVSYVLENNYGEIFRLIEPKDGMFIPDPKAPDFRYSDNNRTIHFTEGEIPFKNDFRYSIKAGLNYDFEIWDFQISPFVAIDYPLNSVVKSYNLNCSPLDCAIRKDMHWKIFYMQAGIDLKYLF